LQEDDNWGLKIDAIEDYCKKRGWKYQVMTETKIHCVRLNNIKDCLTAAKHYAPSNLKKEIGNFNFNLTKFLGGQKKKLKELVHLLKVVLPNLGLEEIISLLKYKIYYHDVSIDWNRPLEETDLLLNGGPPIPVYELPSASIENNIVNKTTTPISEEKTKILSKRDQDEFKERFQLVIPLINKFGKEGKYSALIQFCKENNLPYQKVYKLYLKWRKEGKIGLIPKRVKYHNKSHLDFQVEELLQDTIYKWNTGEWQQIKSAYNEFCAKCYKLNLVPASYETFRLRINKLKAVEKIGKFKPKIQSFIKKGLSSTYREGRYPGSVIQMDHTILDIWLVDSFSKQPLGRPWITLGIDTYSRAIWGFFISFDHPSQEIVTQAIINGLMPKNQLKDWRKLQAHLLKEGLNSSYYEMSSAGFPARIQVDNGRDFRAESVKKFCMDLNITLEFRPLKTPEFGGFIESVWDTINDAIRGAKLPGRVFPLPKSRQAVKQPKFCAPPGYDAKKDAKYTLDDFSEWLFTYFVISYSNDIKANQNYSPNERWINGMRGDNFQPMGGALRLLSPSEYQQIEFKSKITRSSKLSQKGFRYINILYTSEWLIDARKKKILKDGEKYEFKVSHWDIRTIQIVNPVTLEIEILEAYKYEGDDIITEFILKGLGKIPGYRSFPISLKMIQYAKEKLGSSEFNKGESSFMMGVISEKLQEKSKDNIIERKLLEKLEKTNEGRAKLSQAKIIAQMSEAPFPTSQTKTIEHLSLSLEKSLNSEEDNEEEIEGYPTDFDEVRQDMQLGFLFKKEEEEKKNVE